MLQALHILNIFTIIFSSIGVTINVHYCGGEEVSKAIFGKAKSCHHPEIEIKACCAFKAHFAKKKTHHAGCCKDVSKYDDVKKENFISKVEFPKSLFYQVFEFTPFKGSFELVSSFLTLIDLDYHSPPIWLDAISMLCVMRC